MRSASEPGTRDAKLPAWRVEPVRMKIIHVPFGFYPDPVGGTEVYVDALARELSAHDVESVIAAPADQDAEYEHRGIRVRRYGIDPTLQNLRDLYSDGDAAGACNFNRILSDEDPDLVHLHAFSRGASLKMVRAAKTEGIPVVFTYHTPTVTCQRGTMMKWGTECCEGKMDLHTCARCTIQGLLSPAGGLTQTNALRAASAKTLAQLIGRLSPSVGSYVGQRNRGGGVWTALRTTELLELRHAATRALFAEADHIIAVCDWVKNVLVRNNVPLEKISVCRQGTAHHDVETQARREDFRRRSSLEIAFLGRLDPTKGVDILIHALRRIPNAQLRLAVYGVTQGVSGRKYESHLRQMAAPDRRIEFHAPVPVTSITETLKHYDLLAVPSQWLETGPLVVLEAFAAGIPVIGSRQGGIAELVRDGVDGVLVDPSSVEDWASQFRRLSTHTALVRSLRANVRFPRTMSDVAREMAATYRAVLAARSEQSALTAAFLNCV